MSDWGLTAQGFSRPEYAELLEAVAAKAQELFGTEANMSPRSPLGQFMRAFAWFGERLWQVAEDVYNGGYVDTAAGNSLFQLGKLIGIAPLAAQQAIGAVTFAGTPGVTVPLSTLVSNSGNVQFATLTAGLVGADGTVTVNIRAQKAGIEGNVGAGTLTVIVNPVFGVSAVTNADATSGGRYRETDAEFRVRYESSTSRPGGSNVDAIRAEILRVETVSGAVVFENDTDFADSQGLPAHSIEAVVQGGLDSDVAVAIHRRKAAGIQTFGNTSAAITDAADNPRVINFSRPTVYPVYVQVSHLVGTAATQDIADAIIRYVGGTDSRGNAWQGLTIGESVVYTQLPSVINAVPGVVSYTLKIGTSADGYGYANIAVGNRQKATVGGVTFA